MIAAVGSDLRLEPAPRGAGAASGDGVLRISAASSTVPLAELWEYRELLLFLAWRDVTVRYKQTSLGVLWALLQPALMMLIFTLVMGRLAPGAWHGESYALFVLCGLVPWQLVSYALTSSGNSLVSAERLITKVYFPRLVVPLGSLLAGGVDFAIAFALLLLAMVVKGIRPGPQIVGLPLALLLAFLVALAVAILLAALVVKYRDVRHALSFVAQVWLLASPIGYPTSFLPEPWRELVVLNPMTGVVEAFRWALLGQPCPTVAMLVSFVLAAGGLGIGLAYFRRVERTLADVV